MIRMEKKLGLDCSAINSFNHEGHEEHEGKQKIKKGLFAFLCGLADLNVLRAGPDSSSDRCAIASATVGFREFGRPRFR